MEGLRMWGQEGGRGEFDARRRCRGAGEGVGKRALGGGRRLRGQEEVDGGNERLRKLRRGRPKREI